MRKEGRRNMYKEGMKEKQEGRNEEGRRTECGRKEE